jgi:hypothetical protein
VTERSGPGIPNRAERYRVHGEVMRNLYPSRHAEAMDGVFRSVLTIGLGCAFIWAGVEVGRGVG